MTVVAIFTCSDDRRVLAVPVAAAIDNAAVAAAFGAAGCSTGQYAHTAQVRADTDALVWSAGGGGLAGIEVVLPVLVAVVGVRALLRMVRG